GTHVADRDGVKDELGQPGEVIHISANPKYGSEKKGAPTNYYLVAAPAPVRVNCELNHVDIVLCCDPKAFTHTNPLAGLKKGGALVWESNESPEMAWKRIPKKYRDFVKENGIRVFTLPGFEIAKGATDRPDLQLRMQGNSFLGAFFKVSPFMEEFGIDESKFDEVVRAQYEKKFGRFGAAVVESNMKVMKDGFSRVQEIVYGDIDDDDRSSMRLTPVLPEGEHTILPTAGCGFSSLPNPGVAQGQEARHPVHTLGKFDSEFRNGLGYHQPAGALASVGVMAAGTGATASKYVARRETPLYIPENCTQCMECITACPDTALPNTAQDIATVLATAARNYVSDPAQRDLLLAALPGVEERAREKMNAAIEAKESLPFKEIVRAEIDALNSGLTPETKEQFNGILDLVPMAYTKVPAIFKSIEKKNPGQGGLFSIFVSDLCKGCGECVEQCGDHNALVMVDDTEELNYTLTSAQIFSRLLPDTSQKYLGLYDDEKPEDSRPAALRNHLMVRRNYEALVSGDGACAGCGEKSILRAIASVTEAYMRPAYHRKADRLLAAADRLEAEGAARLAELKARDEAEHDLFKQAVAHLLMGLGGENDADTRKRIAENGPVSDEDTVSALTSVLRVDAFNHRKLQATDGRLANGMSVMFMGASTGCNTVYGSTPPSNPHPYPW
ncbi:MAG: 2-oxoacid:acceptor oxidoreductase family protein, partial [Verrucomicrobiae bacterium]|nr:2-oxoacid:acceptor oxidoreductase family protein [Verrucomicrobiae bacterium]